MTNPWGGREPRAGMSRDRANMDTVLISQLDWWSLFCTDPCPVGNSGTGPVGLRKRWSEGRGQLSSSLHVCRGMAAYADENSVLYQLGLRAVVHKGSLSKPKLAFDAKR